MRIKRLNLKKIIVVCIVFLLILFVSYMTYKDTFGSLEERQFGELCGYINRHEHQHAIEFLQKHPKYVNYRSTTSAIQFSVKNACVEMTMILIEMGADVNTHNPDFSDKKLLMNFSPPLFIAVNETAENKPNESEKIIEILLKNGADTSITDCYGKTAYDYAVEKGYTEIAEMIASYQENNKIQTTN